MEEGKTGRELVHPGSVPGFPTNPSCLRLVFRK